MVTVKSQATVFHACLTKYSIAFVEHLLDTLIRLHMEMNAPQLASAGFSEGYHLSLTNADKTPKDQFTDQIGY